MHAALQSEYVALLGPDKRYAVSVNNNRTGELFDPQVRHYIP
jgi:hypothetical protein